MAVPFRRSSGLITSTWYYPGPIYYCGFTIETGDAKLTVDVYDSKGTAAGLQVEQFTTDSNKPTDGHEHPSPSICESGIYVVVSGGSAIVWYMLPNELKSIG